MNTRISMDLSDPRLMKLLKWEARETSSTMKEIVVKALEGYFAHQLESQAILKMSEEVFEEWNDPRDSDYDKL